MKARNAAIQGVLAAAGLLAAYVTWQRPPESTRPDAVTLVDATRQSLERVHYEDGTRAMDLEKKDRMLVTLSYLPGKRPEVDAGFSLESIDGGVGLDGGVSKVAVKPAEPPPDRTLYASERAAALWMKFTPFEGTRALGTLPQEKLDELGLVGTARRLSLTVAGTTRTFLVSRPIPGLIGHYAQDEKSGEVFLVSSSLFNDLDPSSTMLVERRLHAFKQGDFDEVTLKVEGKEAKFVQSGADVPQAAKLARAATPDTPDELAKNWHDKAWSRLVVTDVLGRGEVPKPGEPKVGLRLEYAQRGAPKGWLEIGFDPASGGTWARSENSIGWVAIHQGAEELVLEAKRLVE